MDSKQTPDIKDVPCPFDPNVTNKVLYLCSCGLSQPLSKLYFCRHCLDLRCGFCVSHEVDSHYCPNCLENMPSAEARLKKNRCANCFDCPSCGHTLSTRATSMQLQAPTEDGTNVKIVTKKLYYLVCAFCRWTSRDAGLQDQVQVLISYVIQIPIRIFPFLYERSIYMYYVLINVCMCKNAFTWLGVYMHLILCMYVCK